MSLLDLAGKRGLVVGIANANSIAYGGAKAFHAAGVELNAHSTPSKSSASTSGIAMGA
jgi:enoyl-[acyl-carrier protein] reductase I